MKIENPRGETIDQLFPRLQQAFPQARIVRLIGPPLIHIPAKGFKFVLRKAGRGLVLDHTLPLAFTVVSSAVAAVLGFLFVRYVFFSGGIVVGALIGGLVAVIMLGVKAIFKSGRKAEFEAMRQSIVTAMQGFDFERSDPTTALRNAPNA